MNKTRSKWNCKFGVFSFFTGAGFLDLGFEDADFHQFMGCELMPDFCEAYRYSRQKMGRALPEYGLQEKDIRTFLPGNEMASTFKKNLAEARVKCEWVGFVGGPPCPDFSIAGKNAGSEGHHGQLSQIYADLICAYQPDYFVFENVKGLWRTAKHRQFFDQLVNQFELAGYQTTSRLINSLEYGAPQDRDRIILVGIRAKSVRSSNKLSDLIQKFPWEKEILFSRTDIAKVQWPTEEIFHENVATCAPSGIIQELTVEHWFRKNDVCHHENASDYFTPRAGLVKMQTYSEGDVSRKCYKRLHRWRYSPTAAYGNNEVHLHPYKARRLSVAETLAIQSLPKDYALPPTIPLSSKFKTVGNGVPYCAALGVAKTLKRFLKEIAHV